VSVDPGVEDLLRPLAPQVLGTLARRCGDFAAAEDAVQEALLAASTQWPQRGVPEHPHGWLLTVAGRRLIDQQRAASASRRREELLAARTPPDERHAPAADFSAAETDDALTLLVLCCHPSLTPSAQIALTLRAVGGLSTAEIAAAFLVPEPTMAQRISRAKQRIKADGARFAPPQADQRAERLSAVLHVLYLIFNEGYTASSGPRLQRTELTAEAIRLTRTVRRLLPADGEVAGLLALMLLTDARRRARIGTDGELVPLAEQDRSRWDGASIAEGLEVITEALARAPLGPYQLQAAIAAVHAEASRAEDTDWPQIVELYRLLERVAPNPVVTLNHAVAVGMAQGPRAGLAMLEPLQDDARMARQHRLHAVRAHLLELAGERAAAAAGYRAAARLTTSLPEQRYLLGRAAHCAG